MPSNAPPNIDSAGRERIGLMQRIPSDGHGSEHHAASGLSSDEQNLRQDFTDYDLESGIDDGRSGIPPDHLIDSFRGTQPDPLTGDSRGRNRNRWRPQGDEAEEGNDVPESLLMERSELGGVGDPTPMPVRQPLQLEQPLLGNPRAHQGRGRRDIHRSGQDLPTAKPYRPPLDKLIRRPTGPGVAARSARDKAEWRWANVTNLDQFMLDVYNYYEGCGIWCILTDRGLHLMSVEPFHEQGNTS
jgi:autophagy-related protein 9